MTRGPVRRLVVSGTLTLDTTERCGEVHAGVPVRDPGTGAGFDGLGPTSVNQNRGAESTLAWLATAQLALAGVPA